jgi:hypothetical protein
MNPVRENRDSTAFPYKRNSFCIVQVTFELVAHHEFIQGF